MLMLISPAKTLDFETPAWTGRMSKPAFMADASLLVEDLRQLAPHDISKLMSISDKLGILNYDRFQHWSEPFTRQNARPALQAFRGDVYTGIDADSFSADDRAYANKHLRILSGLYGLLKPLDLMQAYRLEMGTRLPNPRGQDLYAFWGDRLGAAINRAARAEAVVNLASNEYFKSVDTGAIDSRIVTPVFKDWKGGKYKIISFYAKKARGMMVAYAVKNRLQDVEQLKDFDVAGYRYNADMASADEWVFCRDEPV
jgi:cytoplasmic iron level regulating protein YaaA (DUF328/UPF0246 family)